MFQKAVLRSQNDLISAPTPAPLFPLHWLRLQLQPCIATKKWEFFGFNKIKTVVFLYPGILQIDDSVVK